MLSLGCPRCPGFVSLSSAETGLRHEMPSYAYRTIDKALAWRLHKGQSFSIHPVADRPCFHIHEFRKLLNGQAIELSRVKMTSHISLHGNNVSGNGNARQKPVRLARGRVCASPAALPIREGPARECGRVSAFAQDQRPLTKAPGALKYLPMLGVFRCWGVLSAVVMIHVFSIKRGL